MPDGHVQRIDKHKKHVLVVRNGRRFVADIEQVDADARVVGARVHFDVVHRNGVERADRVHLASGTRTNKRQRRFGDLTGAKRPGAKVKSTSSTRLGIDVTSQPLRVARAWVESVQDGRFDDATSLYAPDALLHTASQTQSGRKHIRAAIEDVIAPLVGSGNLDVRGVDQLVVVSGDSGVDCWIEVDSGAITEQWCNTEPAFAHEAEDETQISIIRSGGIDSSQEQRLRDDIQRVAKRVHIPIDQVRVKIDSPATPAHPYSVSVAMHAGALHVRSHVTAPTFEDALDTACLRLRTQLDRATDRRRRTPEQHRPDERSWRHGDRRTVSDLLPAGPTPSERELVRHKSWGPTSSSLDEALWDMDLADYDFYLFVEETTGTPAVVWRSEGSAFYQVADGRRLEQDPEVVTPVTRRALARSPSEAIHQLNETGEPFVFALAADGAAYVVYRRLDGHYGLIEQASDNGVDMEET